VPAHDNGSIQLYQASLTTREQRELERAERTIAKGLKSFLEVGLALKEIRDQRLYRQQFDTFEAYVSERWELSRTRAYELCAASEVVADLSAIADIRFLPENEAQARPLTRLQLPDQRERAWNVALERAAAAGRAVTARDAEDAVKHLSQSASTESIHTHRGRVTLGLRSMLDKIHTGDCVDLLPRLPDGSVDALITDAPFGKRKGVWDVMTKELAEIVVSQALRVLKPTGSFFWFGNNEATADLWPVFKALRPRWLTWFYRNSSNISYATFGWNSQVIVYGHRGDPVFNLDEGRVPYSENTCTTRVNHDESTSHYGIKKNGKSEKTYHPQGRKPMDVIECPAVTAGTERAEGRWHPVQKPLGLMRMLVAVSTNPGDLVLDPFCGSGTTCLAAKQLERHFIGFERDAEFACKARQRLAGA
jgi:site-specific DNA-methyltransferase (adenine-specific)